MSTKTCTECGVAKPISEFGLRSASRDGHRSCCKQCDCARAKNLRARPGAKEKADAWIAANLDKKRKYSRDHYARNRDERKKRVAEYRAANPEKVSRTLAKSRVKNTGAVYARNEDRRQALQKATPPWADMNALAAFYDIAKVMRRHGKDVCVDHIVPIKSKAVCGLHTISNLQIIDRSENFRKNNKHWPQMAEGATK